VLKGAKIVFRNSSSVVDCTVRNLSDAGARLDVPSQAGIPDHFDLLIGGGDKPVKCVVRWRRLASIGVAFET